MTAKYLIDTRKWPPGAMIQLPAGMDIRDVQFLSDNRSEMIRLLDDPAWRESLKVAETPAAGAFHSPGCLFWAGRCNCARAWDTGE